MSRAQNVYNLFRTGGKVKHPQRPLATVERCLNTECRFERPAQEDVREIQCVGPCPKCGANMYGRDPRTEESQ